MPTLKNVKHEMFAQSVALGKTNAQAYEDAGYLSKGDVASAAATRLLKDVKVSDRVAELRSRSDQSVKVILTKSWVIENTIDLMKEAREGAAYGPAAKCLELLAREVNTFVPKAEIGKPGDFSDLTDDQLIDRIHDITSEIRGSRAPSGRTRAPRNPKTLQ